MGQWGLEGGPNELGWRKLKGILILHETKEMALNRRK